MDYRKLGNSGLKVSEIGLGTNTFGANTDEATAINIIHQAIDLGIALWSAAKTAGVLNVDNRIMYTIGAAARKLKLLSSDVVIGFPLSVTGKSPYFDR